jgi:hypothetical protein
MNLSSFFRRNFTIKRKITNSLAIIVTCLELVCIVVIIFVNRINQNQIELTQLNSVSEQLYDARFGIKNSQLLIHQMNESISMQVFDTLKKTNEVQLVEINQTLLEARRLLAEGKWNKAIKPDISRIDSVLMSLYENENKVYIASVEEFGSKKTEHMASGKRNAQSQSLAMLALAGVHADEALASLNATRNELKACGNRSSSNAR